MMTKFRQNYERISTPLGVISTKLGLTPNFWTCVSLITGFAAGVLFALHYIWIGLIVMVIMIITDVLDGATARAGNSGTPFGGVFDHSIDRYVEFALIGGLMVGEYVSPLVGIFIISGMIMASYVRAAAESIGGIKNCVVGLAGRQEKVILLIIGLILVQFGLNIYGQIAFILIGVISHITAVQRLIFTKKNALKVKE
ncbi:MAG: CDP-alcohol phosphatidyltransferase family protein [Anaerolinea sp.]|nr:CDP-alcohol phosphatidyltransferase family protein [Anaerolinea sp.]